MISRLLLNDPRLRLLSDKEQKISLAPQIKELNILHTHYEIDASIKKGAEVYPYMILAMPKNPNYGAIFSPIRGKVKTVGPRFINIEVTEPTAEDPSPVEPLSQETIQGYFASSDKDDARAKLQMLGLGTHQIGKQCDTLILSALNAEPGIHWAEAILNDDFETFYTGMQMQILFSNAKKVYIAVPKGVTLPKVPENAIVKEVDAKYPINVPALLSREVLGEKNPKNVSVVSIHALWSMGRVVKTGLPLIETIITLGTPDRFENYVIKEGTRVVDLFDHINVELKKDDTIILGGPLRGASISLAERGIPKYERGLFVVPKGSVPELRGHNPCSNCGECDRFCPANLAPSIVSKYAEFNMFDSCKEWYAEYCLECGICGYTCMMRRPMLQYMRLAKSSARAIVAVEK